MSAIKRNSTYKTNNGRKNRVFGSYAIEVNLPTGIERITLKGVRDKKTATIFQNKANEIEQRARLFPDDRDWLVESYVALGQQHKIPNYNTQIPTIRVAYEQLIKEKLTYKEVKKESTIETYKLACTLMINILGNIKVSQISAMDKDKFLNEFKKRGWADNTINIRSRNVMLFLRWCLELGYIKEIPFKLKQISVAKRDDNWIQESDFNLICSVMDEVYQSYAIVSRHTGLRLRELNTNPDDEMYKGLYHVLSRKDNHYKIKVYGKGNKVDEIVLPNQFKPYYDVMVANRRNPNNVSKAWKRACEKVGFGHYRFHDIRHTFCSNYALKTTNALPLKLAMRHSSLNTTQGYLNDKKLGWRMLLENIENQA